MSKRFIVFLVVALFALSGCAKTKLVSTWSNPDFSGPTLKKVLVLAVVKNKMQRRLYEDSFVKKLRDGGITAIASYTKLPELSDDKDVNIKKIKALVAETGVDSVLVTTLASVDTDEQYIPASAVYVTGRGGAYGHYGMYDYFGYTHSTVYQSGYTIENTTVTLNATVFSAKNKEMLWSGDTSSLNPGSAVDVIADNINLITEAMKKAGLI